MADAIVASEKLIGILKSIADIAHCGGLASLSEADAITAIRKLTLTHFKKGRSVDQMKMVWWADGEARR